MKTKIFGLDIGSNLIKAVSLARSGDTYLLESVAVMSSTSKGMTSEATSDLLQLSETIKKMLAQANIKISLAAVSIPESQVYTKVIEMPDLSERELSAALEFEMEQYIPLPLDQVRTDWEILGRSNGEAGGEAGKKVIDVMLVAAPLLTLAKYEKLMEMAGLKAEVIETEIVSVHRALLPLFINGPSTIIVHIGSSTSSVAIVKEARIKTVFSIALGGAAITRAISLDLGIDLTSAENYKKAYGLSKDAFEGKIGKSLTPILESITGDIKKAILSFREKNNNEEIKQVILSGGTALLPGIDAYFTNTLGSQVVLGNCFSAYNITNIPNELQIEAPSYNVVVGLALRNLL